MKKLRNLFLIAVVCLTGVLFTDKVSALVIEYPVYSGKMIYNSEYHRVCDSVCDGCKEYNISEDDDINNPAIKLTNVDDESNVVTVYKSGISAGYVTSSAKNIDIDLPTYGAGDFDETQIEGVTKIVYLKDEDEIISAIKNAKKYDNIYAGYVYLSTDELVIPENVTLTLESLGDIKSLVNNGIIKTRGLYGIDKISGTGVINMPYTMSTELGDGGFTKKELMEAERISSVKDISGVKINIIDTKEKEGLSFSLIGATDEVSKEDAQKIIDMYNKVLGDTLNGFEVKLSTMKDEFAGNEEKDYYYGSLVKKVTQTATTTTVKKEEVKNPKTGDTILYIVGAIILSASALVVSYKKIRQN